MRKYICSMVFVILAALLLTACSCEHEWINATCAEPVTCSKCGETAGDPAEHRWTEATCTSPETCKACGATEGVTAEHDWAAATCTSPKTCKACGATEGAEIEHTWINATCTEAACCSVCELVVGTPAGHVWIEATTSNPKTCATCKATEGEPLQKSVVGSYKHTYMENGSEVYDALEFSADGSVVFCFYYKTEGFSGHCEVPGTWRLNNNTVSITLTSKRFEFYFASDLYFEGDTSTATLTSEGLLWNYTLYKKLS